MKHTIFLTLIITVPLWAMENGNTPDEDSMQVDESFEESLHQFQILEQELLQSEEDKQCPEFKKIAHSIINKNKFLTQLDDLATALIRGTLYRSEEDLNRFFKVKEACKTLHFLSKNNGSNERMQQKIAVKMKYYEDQEMEINLAWRKLETIRLFPQIIKDMRPDNSVAELDYSSGDDFE